MGTHGMVRTLQFAGVVVLALTAVALVCAGRLWRRQPSGWMRVGNGLMAVGLLGLVWIGLVGGLISFRLNY